LLAAAKLHVAPEVEPSTISAQMEVACSGRASDHPPGAGATVPGFSAPPQQACSRRAGSTCAGPFWSSSSRPSTASALSAPIAWGSSPTSG